MIDKQKLWDELNKIPDPELGISIVELGLIYKLDVDKGGVVSVNMTLTTMGCPLFELIAGPIQENLKKIDGVKDVLVELTFEPPWSPEKMTEEAKVKLGFF
ncbi:metal-sulfur cluster assembly factor [Candidatus Gottesmanbacteria bacterium]|nr:metal-sulfur cluster assembly factor [Candidatus Gottesmanbacteria bacterium]